MVIDDVEAFATGMQKLGQEYGYPPLETWGEQLAQQAQMFDMDTIPRTLATFPEVIEDIRTLIREQ